MTGAFLSGMAEGDAGWRGTNAELRTYLTDDAVIDDDAAVWCCGRHSAGSAGHCFGCFGTSGLSDEREEDSANPTLETNQTFRFFSGVEAFVLSVSKAIHLYFTIIPKNNPKKDLIMILIMWHSKLNGPGSHHKGEE